MPRVKEITVFGNFVIVAKNKKTTVYKCKLCSKCLTTSSSTRLKQHLESCYVINEESSHEKRLKTDFEIIAVDDDLDNRNETNMSPQLVNLPNSSVSQGSSKCTTVAALQSPSFCNSRSSSQSSFLKFADIITTKEIVDTIRCLARWIYVDNLPFDIVESIFFCNG
jgi:hypothetical protein